MYSSDRGIIIKVPLKTELELSGYTVKLQYKKFMSDSLHDLETHVVEENEQLYAQHTASEGMDPTNYYIFVNIAATGKNITRGPVSFSVKSI